MRSFFTAQWSTLCKNLGNLLIDLVDHPEVIAHIKQTIADIEQFFIAPAA